MGKKIALALLGLAVLYLGAAFAMALRATSAEQQVIADVVRLVALADAAKVEEPTTTLAEACVKVPRVERTRILAYYPVPADGVLAGEDDKHWYEAPRLMGLDTDRFQMGVAKLPMEPRGLEHWVMEFLSDVPPYWGMYAAWAFRPFNQPITDTKYLVVHRLTSLEMPTIFGDSYSPGRMRFTSAVVDGQSGKVLCAGTTAIDQSGSVQLAGSGKTKEDAKRAMEDSKDKEVRSMFFIDLHFFALRDVCWLADESICKLTFGTWQPP
jgi:hypothetical protein